MSGGVKGAGETRGPTDIELGVTTRCAERGDCGIEQWVGTVIRRACSSSARVFPSTACTRRRDASSTISGVSSVATSTVRFSMTPLLRTATTIAMWLARSTSCTLRMVAWSAVGPTTTAVQSVNEVSTSDVRCIIDSSWPWVPAKKSLSVRGSAPARSVCASRSASTKNR